MISITYSALSKLTSTLLLAAAATTRVAETEADAQTHTDRLVIHGERSSPNLNIISSRCIEKLCVLMLLRVLW